MARVKLGALVTSIIGSVGGTTFKRVPTGFSMNNKLRVASLNKIYKNSQLGAIGSVFRSWNNLSAVQKADWALIAETYFFPDQFGDLKNLTARQLFTRLNLQLLPVGLFNAEADQVTSEVGFPTVENFDITNSLTSAEVQYNVSSGFAWVLCQVEVGLGSVNAPIFSRRKIIAATYVDGAGGFDIIEYLLENFPYINSSYNVRVYVTCMNNIGWRSVTVYRDAVWSA